MKSKNRWAVITLLLFALANKRYAVTADNFLAEARAKLDSIPRASSSYARENIRRTQLVPWPKVTREHGNSVW